MTTLKFRTYLNIGDWSDDGHGRTRFVPVQLSHSREEVQRAYIDSCNRWRFCFHNHDWPVPGFDSQLYGNSIYFLDCEDGIYRPFDIEAKQKMQEMLRALNCPEKYFDAVTGETMFSSADNSMDFFVDFMMWWCSLSLPDFVWEVTDEDWYQDCFNRFPENYMGFGYELLMD